MWCDASEAKSFSVHTFTKHGFAIGVIPIAIDPQYVK